MNRIVTTLLAALWVASALAGAAGATMPQSGTCIENWSDAAPIVTREGLMAARDVQLIARRRHASDIVRITLCRETEGYVYRLLMRDARGQISHVKIDALPLVAARP